MHSWGNTCSERLNRAWGEPKTRERFSLGKDFFSSWLLRSSSKAKLRKERRKEGRKKEKKGEKIEESDGGEGESLRNEKISSAKCQLMTN